VESSCELGNEPSGSIKCWETTDWLHNLRPLSSTEIVSYYIPWSQNCLVSSPCNAGNSGDSQLMVVECWIRSVVILDCVVRQMKMAAGEEGVVLEESGNCTHSSEFVLL
jgi:hypothetical protein